MPDRAKPPLDRNEVSPEPMTSTCAALLRLGREVADKRSKRATMPALPHAIERYTRLAEVEE